MPLCQEKEMEQTLSDKNETDRQRRGRAGTGTNGRVIPDAVSRSHIQKNKHGECFKMQDAGRE